MWASINTLKADDIKSQGQLFKITVADETDEQNKIAALLKFETLEKKNMFDVLKTAISKGGVLEQVQKKPEPTPTKTPKNTVQPKDGKKSNMMLYIGCAVGGVLLLVIIIFAMSSGSDDNSGGSGGGGRTGGNYDNEQHDDGVYYEENAQDGEPLVQGEEEEEES